MEFLPPGKAKEPGLPKQWPELTEGNDLGLSQSVLCHAGWVRWILIFAL